MLGCECQTPTLRSERRSTNTNYIVAHKFPAELKDTTPHQTSYANHRRIIQRTFTTTHKDPKINRIHYINILKII
jgi:hypothetical protein